MTIGRWIIGLAVLGAVIGVAALMVRSTDGGEIPPHASPSPSTSAPTTSSTMDDEQQPIDTIIVTNPGNGSVQNEGSPSSSASPPDSQPEETTDRVADSKPEETIRQVVAVGDIAQCGSDNDEAVADLVRAIAPEVILVMGDLAYGSGSLQEYEECWTPSWGDLDPVIQPSPGNHDYRTPGAAGYFAQFGARVGSEDESWYAFETGGWHVVSVDSNCSEGNRCEEGSSQLEWLARDLEASDASCTIAYSHHPRFSSGFHGDTGKLDEMWAIFERGGVDVVLAGHEHSYERFGPQDRDRSPDEEGIVLFVAGTGGAGLREFPDVKPNSLVRESKHGVLELQLGEQSYEWAFRSLDDEIVDSGAGECANDR